MSFTVITGWEPDTKTLIEHGFYSNGDNWNTRWKLGKEKWSGQGTGLYMGKEWKSPTKLELKKDSYRYEDTTEGKPFVIVSKRKKS